MSSVVQYGITSPMERIGVNGEFKHSGHAGLSPSSLSYVLDILVKWHSSRQDHFKILTDY